MHLQGARAGVGVVVGGGSTGVAPALVWARAWLRSTLPTMYHRLDVGGENGHGFSREVFDGWVAEGTIVAPVNVRALEV